MVTKYKHEEIPSNGEILLYQPPDGTTRLDVRLRNETVWLSIDQMAHLLGVDKSGISRHLKNIFDSGELDKELVVAKNATTAVDGKNYEVSYYNLDVIISVGYRVNSLRGTQVRQWATQRIREYIVKGFTIDDERLKNPPIGNNEVSDYFDELLERIRDIRASERRMYLRVRDIFSMAGDYQIGNKATTQFFTFIQDKLHVAVTGKTSAELIMERASHLLPDMGLTNHPKDDIRKCDTIIGKNYLTESEILELNRIVSMWLDFAEDQATRRKQIFLKDWTKKLDEFLQFNDRVTLEHHGRVSRESANAPCSS